MNNIWKNKSYYPFNNDSVNSVPVPEAGHLDSLELLLQLAHSVLLTDLRSVLVYSNVSCTVIYYKLCIKSIALW